MSAQEDTRAALESAISNVYRGPLEEFISRRDALTKELRSAGDRESANAVKALKKPSRPAWALNLAALDGGQAIDALVDAIRETVDMQAAGGDLRTSIAGMRTAVREFANVAARAAGLAGHAMDPGVLGNALTAVLGKTESFEQLRRGQLTDVPEAGGLDLLTSLPTLADAAPRAAAKPARPAGAAPSAAPPPSPPKPSAREVAARDAVQKADAAYAKARDRSTAAQEALRNAEAKVKEAERRLREMEDEVRKVRGDVERARKEADAAAAELRKAENATVEADRRLKAI